MFAVPVNTVATVTTLATAHPVRIAREFARDRDRWRHLLRYDPDARWLALVERTPEREVWLLSWLPGQGTDLHDHGAATGAFTIVSGVLSERVIRTGGQEQSAHRLEPGQSRVFGPRYLHQVSNDGVDPAVSIHVYHPARGPMTHYREDRCAGLSIVDRQVE
jgi:predicted metal-dependent enzyme (double-stranded beta helix superfamily)